MARPGKSSHLLVLTGLLGLAGEARAMEVFTEEEPPRPEVAREADAAAHHGLVTPRAQTLRGGETAIHLQGLALLGLSYGYTDDVQATVQALLPVEEGLPVAGLVRGKVVLRRGPRAVVAGRVDLGLIWPPSGGGGGPEDLGIAATYGFGATADLHLDAVDRLVVGVGGSTHIGAGGALGRSVDIGSSALFLYEGSGRLRLRGPVHLLAEIWIPAVLHEAEVDLAPYVVAPVGLRLATGLVSLDAGFILGKAEDLDPSDFPIGVPWVSGSLRFR